MPALQRHSGFLIQARGSPGPFELILPSSTGGLAHFWRDNANAGLPWHGPQFFASGRWEAASTLESPWALECVARQGDRIAHFHRSVGTWHAPHFFASGCQGNPAFIQGTLGDAANNFEVVVPRAAGGLLHFFRNNAPLFTQPWQGTGAFGTGNVLGVALVQNGNGNLEVVAREGNRLVHYWRDGSGWHGPTPVATGVRGTPAFVQGSFGRAGNFEVVAPAEGGGLLHVWRNNDDPALPWSPPLRFGSGIVSDVGLVQSSFGPGNLEVVAREGGRVAFYWRLNGPPWTWSGPSYPLEQVLRVHTKVLADPSRTGIDAMFDNMRTVYETAWLRIERATTERLDLPALADLDVNCSGIGWLSAEQEQLFANRRDVGDRDVVVYFVRSTVPSLNGCAAHPNGRPGAVVTSVASPWTLAHEFGHVLGLGHVGDADRLMMGSGTDGITNPPPDLATGEVHAMRNHDLTR